MKKIILIFLIILMLLFMIFGLGNAAVCRVLP